MKTVVGVVIAVIMVLLSAYSGFAQGKFSLSVSGAPTYSYLKAKQTFLLPGNSNGNIIPVDVSSRITGRGYTVGVMGKYEFVPRWSVSTGVWMSYTRTDMPSVETNTPSVDFIVGQTRGRNVQVPVLVNFQSSTRRLSPYFSAGALLSFRSTNYLNIGNDQEIRIKTGKHAVTVVPTVGVGAIYRMSNHLSLAVQPTFNYYLPQGTYSSYFSGRASLQTQVFYTF
ncbi:outer membrane beta-barrel protein [Spirosoma rhododendri]|uniref:PorT family protein n=1 Tax=Spirosoma rhododendri TaxID=2728024 RepID=A0A7L5DRQ3_9BACT|nr:outer membrane beta-barrel protein [Spirosoma rhododendri]QJD80805.1 PorT family protein [Spirosoma rhododendri]